MSVTSRGLLLCALCWLPLLAVADNREDQLRAGLAAMDRQHYATAMRAWYDLAAAGDPQAQHNIGYLYEEGLGVTQQYDVAMDWYRRAADGGAGALATGDAVRVSWLPHAGVVLPA